MAGLEQQVEALSIQLAASQVALEKQRYAHATIQQRLVEARTARSRADRALKDQAAEYEARFKALKVVVNGFELETLQLKKENAALNLRVTELEAAAAAGLAPAPAAAERDGSAAVREEMHKLQEENAALKQQVAELKAAAATASTAAQALAATLAAAPFQ